VGDLPYRNCQLVSNYFPLSIDQFLTTKGGILKSSKLWAGEFSDGASVQIEMFSEMDSGGRYPSPVRFGRPSSKTTFHPDTGYSDHYPVSMIMTEK
jgi:hypothetical protein